MIGTGWIRQEIFSFLPLDNELVNHKRFWARDNPKYPYIISIETGDTKKRDLVLDMLIALGINCIGTCQKGNGIYVSLVGEEYNALKEINGVTIKGYSFECNGHIDCWLHISEDNLSHSPILSLNYNALLCK